MMIYRSERLTFNGRWHIADQLGITGGGVLPADRVGLASMRPGANRRDHGPDTGCHTTILVSALERSQRRGGRAALEADVAFPCGDSLRNGIAQPASRHIFISEFRGRRSAPAPGRAAGTAGAPACPSA